MSSTLRPFASDNYAPAHPQVMDAVVAANSGSFSSYGADPYTAQAAATLAQALGCPTAQVSFVTTGSAANVLGLNLLLRPWQSVICAQSAHIANDEGGAPERLLGTKLVTLDTPDGLLTPEQVERAVVRVGDEHATQAAVVSITQSTELGTLYTPEQIAALADTAHRLGLYLHLDGARLGNAAASLGCSLADLTSAAGVDVLSFGATKNGALSAEAVVTLRPELATNIRYLHKQLMQLISKHRYVAAQVQALLTDELWRRNAEHANAMAARLHKGVAALGVQVTQAVQVNSVFAVLPPEVTTDLQTRNQFYLWDETTGEVRWMCAWDTTPELVDEFIADIGATLARLR